VVGWLVTAWPVLAQIWVFCAIRLRGRQAGMWRVAGPVLETGRRGRWRIDPGVA
jgi:hypothetical protein